MDLFSGEWMHMSTRIVIRAALTGALITACLTLLALTTPSAREHDNVALERRLSLSALLTDPETPPPLLLDDPLELAAEPASEEGLLPEVARPAPRFSASPASERIVRVVALPYGTERIDVAGIAVTGEAQSRSLPDGAATGSVLRMRGFPIGILSLSADAIRAVAGADADRADLIVTTHGSAAAAPPPAGPLPLLARADLQRLMAAPRNPDGSALTGQGCYLIITAPGFETELAPLIAWKREIGFDVRLYTTDETGTTTDAIRAFLQNAYTTWPNPPLYVLLAGDLDRIPTWMVSGIVSDHPYSRLDGDDFLADVFLGRLSASTLSEVALQVAKTVGYESLPDTTGGDPWFERALLVAGNYNSSTPVALNRWVGEELRKTGYQQTDSVFWSNSPQHPWWVGRTPIRLAINRGVGIVNYRGWAYGAAGWQPPEYLKDDIPLLQNGWKLPVVFSIVCHTGDYSANDCMGEAWVRAGTPAAPRGAVAFVGTGETWSHSRWNDRVDINVFEGICHNGLRRFGAIVNGAKVALIPDFPTEILMSDAWGDEEESVEYYNHAYNILGDPSLQVWTATPRPVVVSGLPATFSQGQGFVEVSVKDAGTAALIGGARIALTQGGTLVGYGESSATSSAPVHLALQSTDPVTITVTGENLYPVRLARNVAPEVYALTCAGATPAAGASVMPGREVTASLSATNTGTTAIGSASAFVVGPPQVQMLASEATFGAIEVGGTATSQTSVRFRPDASVVNGTRLRFLVTPTIQGSTRTPSEFTLIAEAPELVSVTLSDGGDGIFSPGEQAPLIVTLRNDGVASGALDVRLRAAEPGSIAILDSTATIATIATGATGHNTDSPFSVRLPATTAVGTIIPLTLDVVSLLGPHMTVALSLTVGDVDFAAPTGPDAYGYYAYDSADIDYPAQAPVYEWIECSPLFGGAGEKLVTIDDNSGSPVITLPFAFTYYQRTYNAMRITDNGWVAFDLASWLDIRNWNMPDKWGSACQIAAFWDNLVPVPDPDDPALAGIDGVYMYNDQANHRLVIEWSRLKNWETYTDDLQTFEMILYDPVYYPTPTGDGEIAFQYKQVANDDWQRMYATIGIEDHTEEIGLVYSYGNQYAAGAAPLSSGLAIRYTTATPVYEPLAVSEFTALWVAPHGGNGVAGGGALGDSEERAVGAGAGRIEITWELPASPALVGLSLYRSAQTAPDAWGAFEKVHSGLLGPGCRSFSDAACGLDPNRAYAYRLEATDRYGKTRRLGETGIASGAGLGLYVRVAGPTIASHGLAIEFAAPGEALHELAVYDAQGRRVADLRAQVTPTSDVVRSITWSGSDAAGRRLPSGLYWIRLRAGGESRVAKAVLVR
jgi:hypothetical protein